MALSFSYSCLSSIFSISSVKNQERSLFAWSKIDLTSFSQIFTRSRVLQRKCVNQHLIPLDNDFGDSSTLDGPVKQFKATPDHFPSPEQNKSTVSITVVGASGDLAKKKIFPALFALYYEDSLPEHFTIFGYARTKMTNEELRNMISRTLTCRIHKRENCNDKMEKFLQRCYYHSGQYGSEENFKEMGEKLKEKEENITDREAMILGWFAVNYVKLMILLADESKGKRQRLWYGQHVPWHVPLPFGIGIRGTTLRRA